jgi:hypothetical protein
LENFGKNGKFKIVEVRITVIGAMGVLICGVIRKK